MRKSTLGLSDAWETQARDLLNDAGMQRHLEGFAVPLEEQVTTLAGHIQRAVDGHDVGNVQLVHNGSGSPDHSFQLGETSSLAA